jgi:hypothetical protein
VEVKTVVVHTFFLSDVEDPDLFAADSLLSWQESEAGKWIMEHAVDIPIWHKDLDIAIYGYKYRITARLTAKDYTFWCLKWAHQS